MRDRHVRPRRCPGAAYRGPRTRTTAATAAPAFICTRRVLASPHVRRIRLSYNLHRVCRALGLYRTRTVAFAGFINS